MLQDLFSKGRSVFAGRHYSIAGLFESVRMREGSESLSVAPLGAGVGSGAAATPEPFEALRKLHPDFVTAAENGDERARKVLLAYSLMKHHASFEAVRRTGKPAYTHDLSAASMFMPKFDQMTDEDFILICGEMLHDVPENSRTLIVNSEDKKFSRRLEPHELSILGFPSASVDMIESMTRRETEIADEDEPYFDYAVRVGHNLNGAAGKYVDNYLNIMDNLKILPDGRKNYDTLTDRQKRKHDIAYMVSMHYHSARLTGQVQAGTPMAEFVKMKWAGKPEFDYIVAHWKQYSSEAPPVADVSVEPEPDIAA